ncbi:MAG: NAD-dependent epimerase/dehydratase family protein [Actinobacteria bacterium]|nr:NAD-dependent epimerase/dehydratase family protein [Actinomycetota bacterium]
MTVGAACQLAEAALELGVSKLVVASSGGIYGSRKEPFRECSTPAPRTRLDG